MKVTREKTENSQAFLTMEVDPAEVEESLEQAYQRLVKKANIPGFRKGKAPRPVLERHIGRDRLFESAVDILIPEAYEKAIKEQEIEAFAQPQIEITRTEPLVFKAVVPLKPRVKLGDYHHLKVDQTAAGEVTEAQVDAVLTELRHRHADFESIELRSADYGDMLIIDLESKIGDKPISEQKNVPYELKADYPAPVPGFAAQLNGMKKGETKEFKLTIPADYTVADLVGKEATFKVKVHDISQEILPELDDKFASMVRPELTTLAELRQYISNELKQSEERRVKQKFEDQILDMVIGLSEIEFPTVMVEAEINRIINQRFPRGREEMEAYLKRINKTPGEFHEGLHPFAANQIRGSLVLGKVAEEEKIEVGDDELEVEIENVVASVEENREQARRILNTPQNRETIKNNLRTRKTIERLTDIVKSASVATEKKEEEKK